nr:arylsulfatase [Polymorphobacter sp.]
MRIAKILLAASALTLLSAPVLAQSAPAATLTPARRPNIVVIWGDDVGMWNISAYHRGMMGGTTPNIDRIANEGMLLMTQYAESSCTAGRAAFITGQMPLRVGLATVGLPGSKVGLQKEDPTLAEMLKPLGYATGQFGKNHLGDRDEYLPTAHGFDEFYGIVYHLNAGEYPEQYDFPKGEAAKGFKQRGIIHSWATGNGNQKIEDLGPFGQEVQRTLDEKTMVQTTRFINDSVKSGKPFFLWQNFSWMHYRTNLSPKWDGKTGYGTYADGMAEMDSYVGQILDQLKALGVEDNTIVIFSTDNGAASNSWPDGGNQPFKGQKGVGGYEGGYRVPAMIRWPGVVKPGSISAGIIAQQDWMPTFMAAEGQPDLKQKLLAGQSIGGRTYKVHLDGYDQTAMLSGSGPSARKEYYYFTENKFHGVRVADWKFLYTSQDSWFNGTRIDLTTPVITNLALDPFERFTDARGHDEWQENRSWTLPAAAGAVSAMVESFREFPPRQDSDEYTMSNIGEQIKAMRKPTK